MSSLSSITTIPIRRRTTSTALVVRPAATIKALPTPSSRQGTSARPASWSGCWRRPGRPSIPSCCSWLTPDVAEAEEEVAVPVSVAPPVRTTPTWCTRMSVTGECVLPEGAVAPRRVAAAAATATVATAETVAVEAAGTGIAPLPPRPPLTEIAVAGTADAAMAPAPTRTTSTRITAAAMASTAAPGAPLVLGATEWGRSNRPRQFPSLWWLSSSTPHSPWWGWWGTRHSSLLLHPRLLPQGESNVVCAPQSQTHTRHNKRYTVSQKCLYFLIFVLSTFKWWACLGCNTSSVLCFKWLLPSASIFYWVVNPFQCCPLLFEVKWIRISYVVWQKLVCCRNRKENLYTNVGFVLWASLWAAAGHLLYRGSNYFFRCIRGECLINLVYNLVSVLFSIF